MATLAVSELDSLIHHFSESKFIDPPKTRSHVEDENTFKQESTTYHPSSTELAQITDEIDPNVEESQFEHSPVRAWRWDENENKWRRRGNGKLSIYYNKTKQLGKIIFIDDKYEKIRLLQYIDGDKYCQRITDEDEIEWEAGDYSMDHVTPLPGRWKLNFGGHRIFAMRFLEIFNKYIHKLSLSKNSITGYDGQSAIERLDYLVAGYMTNEFQIKTRNYQHELNMIIMHFLGTNYLLIFALTIMKIANDREILSNWRWAFGYLSHITLNNDKLAVQEMINDESLRLLNELLSHSSVDIRHKSLMCISNIDRFTPSNINYLQQGVVRKVQMIQRLPQYVQGCHSDHLTTKFDSTQRIRKLLSIERAPPIQFVIDSGIVPRLVDFLQMDDHNRIQFEAAWALTNIVSGSAEHTAFVIKCGAIPMFVKLLQSPSDEVKEQAVWALGNIAGDGPESRNCVLFHGALSWLAPLCDVDIQSQQRLCLLRNTTWTLSNFCRGKGFEDMPNRLVTRYMKNEFLLNSANKSSEARINALIISFLGNIFSDLAIEMLTKLIQHDDTEILQDCCWAFSYLSDASSVDEQEQIIYPMMNAGNKGAINRIIDLLDHQSKHVRHPALRTIGNILTGSDQQTQKLIDLGVLKKLNNLLNNNDLAVIKRETCWAISNITAGSQQQIEAVIESNLFQILINILHCDKYEIRKEALWAISNATDGATDEQIIYLVHQGIIGPLCQFLKTMIPSKIMLVVLEAIGNILAVGHRIMINDNNRYNQFAKYVKQCDGFQYLEELISNQEIAESVLNKSTSIIRKYFN